MSERIEHSQSDATQPRDDRRAADCSIRSASLTDAGAIAQLSGQLGYPVAEPEMRRRLAQRADLASEAVLVAEDRSGAVAGFIHLFDCPPLIGNPQTIEIGGLVVDSRCRSQGIGAALVCAGEAWAVKRGFHYIRVRSNVVRGPAHAFYQGLGYSIIKSQHVFELSFKQITE